MTKPSTNGLMATNAMRAIVLSLLLLTGTGCAHRVYWNLRNGPDVLAVRQIEQPNPTAPPCAAYALAALQETRQLVERERAATERGSKVAELLAAHERQCEQVLVEWPAFAAQCRPADRMFEVVAFTQVTYVIHGEGRDVARLIVPIAQPLVCGPGSYTPPWPISRR